MCVSGVARKVKKAYIGVGGVARPCYFEGLEYYGTATALSVARDELAATTVGNYALFGGGRTGLSCSEAVDAYSTSLTRTAAITLSKARNELAATTVGSYALFGGGYSSSINVGSKYVAIVDAYNTSLTRTTASALNQKKLYLAATTVGNYALFGGGKVDGATGTVDAYNESLTRTKLTALSKPRYYLAATTVGNYALFGGGYSSGATYDTVDVYTA